MRYFFYSYTVVMTGKIGTGRRWIRDEQFPSIPQLEKLTIEIDNEAFGDESSKITNVCITNIFEFKNEEDYNNSWKK